MAEPHARQITTLRLRRDLDCPWAAPSLLLSLRRNRIGGEAQVLTELLQLRVFRLGFPQDGNVAVGIFPQRQEILIRNPRITCIAL